MKLGSGKLLEWFQDTLKEYEDIAPVTDISSSWTNGLAFCALVHIYKPTATYQGIPLGYLPLQYSKHANLCNDQLILWGGGFMSLLVEHFFVIEKIVVQYKTHPPLSQNYFMLCIHVA